jgi:hypothetical protein
MEVFDFLYKEEKINRVAVKYESGSSNKYVIPAKDANDSTSDSCWPIASRSRDCLYWRVRVYDPLDEGDTLTHKYVIHGAGEYIDGLW